MSIQKMLKKDEGFTLVELLIVIAIIAILAAIAIPQFTKYRNKAYDAELQATAKNAYTAAQAYLSDFPNATCCDATQLEAGGLVIPATSTITGAAGGAISGSIAIDGTGTMVLESAAVAAASGNKTATIKGNGDIVYTP